MKKFFKHTVDTVVKGGETIGKVAKDVATAPVTVATKPVQIAADAVGLKPVSNVVKDIHHTVETVESAAVDATVHHGLAPTLAVCHLADAATSGDPRKIGQAIKEEVVLEILAPMHVEEIVVAYLASLRAQAQNKWAQLPAKLIEILTHHYPDCQLSSIQYATDINTIHGAAITFENQIFFPTELNLYEYANLHWLLHELEHVQQYKQVGGLRSFLARYFNDASVKIIQHKSLSIHDNLELEAAANRKADAITDDVFKAWTAVQSSLRI
jgi:hypothetical protein